VQLGMIGLGRMGANMSQRLMAGGHEVVAYDVSAAAVGALQDQGAVGTSSLEELAAKLNPPRHVWLMVPAALTKQIATDVADHLEAGDCIVNGGNSYFHDDVAVAAEIAPKGIHYVDCGVSGGVWGRERGYGLMLGGDDEAVGRLDPVFRVLAPGIDAAPRTPGRDTAGIDSTAELGYYHCGPVGAGHFVKMVHNGIEYGMMAAIAEGLNIIANAGAATAAHDVDAETAPLIDPDLTYDIDIREVAEVWRRGTVISSWLVDLTAAALVEDPELSTFGGRVSDSGEGRWTVLAAVAAGVPAHVLSAALFDRFESRGASGIADKLLSAMRYEFGGHKEKPAQ